MSTDQPLEIFVAPENVREYISVYRAIRTFTDKNSSVPSTLVKAFFDLMQNPHRYRMDQIHEKAKRLSKIAAEKIKSKKGYQFNWSDTVLNDNNVVIKNDTAKIFLELIYAFLLFDKDHNAGKDDAIIFFYQVFEDEYKSKVQTNDQVSFTQYKQAVISGLLTMAAGFQLTTKVEPTNEEIYQATRNAIKKYQKE